jgi:predicted phage terminase large subunit-like protein
MSELLDTEAPKRLLYVPRQRMPVRVTLTLDPAVTDKKRSDFSAFIVNMTNIEGKWHIWEADAFKGKPDEVISRAMQLIRLYRPAAIAIETVAAQILFKSLLRPAMEAEDIHTPITEYMPPNQYSKRAKIERLQPRFKQGQIAIRRGLKELCRQLDEFPENDHDDLLDALCQQDAVSRPPLSNEIHGSFLDEDLFDLEEDYQDPSQKRKIHANVGYGTPRRR